MDATGNQGYLIQKRNAEILREITITRLEGRLRANEATNAGTRGIRSMVQRVRLALSGSASAEPSTTS